MRFTALATLAIVLTLTACHSAFIDATVHNGSAATISPFEVDYPSASFGETTLAPGADFHYRFKVLGSGQTKVLWTDAQHIDHTQKGPELKEGSEGTLTVTVRDANAAILFVPKAKP